MKPDSINTPEKCLQPAFEALEVARERAAAAGDGSAFLAMPEDRARTVATADLNLASAGAHGSLWTPEAAAHAAVALIPADDLTRHRHHQRVADALRA